MNRFLKHPRSLFLLVGTAILLGDLWIGWNCRSLRQDALTAAEQLAASERLASRIESLRRSPVQVEEGVRTSDALARMVESVSRTVGLNPDRIADIAPGEPRRVADSPYLEQATTIELRETTLRQVVEFTITLTGSQTGIEVPHLTLRIPASGENSPGQPELWNAQILLTSRIYAPKIPAASLSK